MDRKINITGRPPAVLVLSRKLKISGQKRKSAWDFRAGGGNFCVGLYKYGREYVTRHVTNDGTIRIEGCKILISRTLIGWDIGLKYIDENSIEVWFDYLLLGEINLKTERFTAADKFN